MHSRWHRLIGVIVAGVLVTTLPAQSARAAGFMPEWWPDHIELPKDCLFPEGTAEAIYFADFLAGGSSGIVGACVGATAGAALGLGALAVVAIHVSAETGCHLEGLDYDLSQLEGTQDAVIAGLAKGGYRRLASAAARNGLSRIREKMNRAKKTLHELNYISHALIQLDLALQQAEASPSACGEDNTCLKSSIADIKSRLGQVFKGKPLSTRLRGPLTAFDEYLAAKDNCQCSDAPQAVSLGDIRRLLDANMGDFERVFCEQIRPNFRKIGEMIADTHFLLLALNHEILLEDHQDPNFTYRWASPQGPMGTHAIATFGTMQFVNQLAARPSQTQPSWVIEDLHQCEVEARRTFYARDDIPECDFLPNADSNHTELAAFTDVLAGVFDSRCIQPGFDQSGDDAIRVALGGPETADDFAEWMKKKIDQVNGIYGVGATLLNSAPRTLYEAFDACVAGSHERL